MKDTLRNVMLKKDNLLVEILIGSFSWMNGTIEILDASNKNRKVQYTSATDKTTKTS